MSATGEEGMVEVAGNDGLGYRLVRGGVMALAHRYIHASLCAAGAELTHGQSSPEGLSQEEQDRLVMWAEEFADVAMRKLTPLVLSAAADAVIMPLSDDPMGDLMGVFGVEVAE